MAPYQDRLQMLETRCSEFAKELLRQLKNHPLFPSVMGKLERIEGPIYRTDVEQAFLECKTGK